MWKERRVGTIFTKGGLTENLKETRSPWPGKGNSERRHRHQLLMPGKREQLRSWRPWLFVDMLYIKKAKRLGHVLWNRARKRLLFLLNRMLTPFADVFVIFSVNVDAFENVTILDHSSWLMYCAWEQNKTESPSFSVRRFERDHFKVNRQEGKMPHSWANLNVA